MTLVEVDGQEEEEGLRDGPADEEEGLIDGTAEGDRVVFVSADVVVSVDAVVHIVKFFLVVLKDVFLVLLPLLFFFN